MICIIDYQAGNLQSVKRALDYLNIKSIISDNPQIISQSEKIIFPGVGAAGETMITLKKKNLDTVIKQAFKDNKIILGICLGTQIFLESSQENNTKTLNLIQGQCQKFNLPQEFTIPHIGWNQVQHNNNHPLFEKIPSQTNFYFVHSYYPVVSSNLILATSNYGGKIFASAITKANLVATQFHPEKSGKHGLQLLKNFANWKGIC